MAINSDNTKMFADAYYGESAAVGDGTLLKKLMELLMGMLGDCPFGARRAHALVNGNERQQRRAKERVWWEVYGATGDEELADNFSAATLKAGKKATVEEFADFAKP